MTVELPRSTLDAEPPVRPATAVWLCLLAAFLAAGALLTLLAWPKDAPTGTPWFWMCLVGFPLLGWCVLFGFRLHFYEDEMNRLTATADARQREFEAAVAFGAEPLAVLHAAYLCAMRTGCASGLILERDSVLVAHSPRPHLPPVRHSRLPLAEEVEPGGRYAEVFEAILGQLEMPLRALPPSVPLDVTLQVSDGVDPAPLRHAWQTCWTATGLHHVEASVLPANDGLMALDAWLDETGGPALERFRLFVAVQLHETPPQNSAEAAVALLLGWAPLAERLELPAIATLHRPVAAAHGLADTIRTAALFGQITPDALTHLWQSGLQKAEKAAMLTEGSDIALGAVQTDAFAGVHDIDAALGNPGVATPWLAAALAVENARQRGEPQLIACRESTLCLAVVRPPAGPKEQETT
jgi:hypothetical protein